MNTVAAMGAALCVMVGAVALHPRRIRLEPRATSLRSDSLLGDLATTWRRRRAMRRPPNARHVAEWCDELARHLRGGSSLREALVTVVPGDDRTSRLTATMRFAIERGHSVHDAIDRVESNGPDLHIALSVLATASRIGGPCAAAVDRTAMSLRQRAADSDERSGQAAQARLSSQVMTAVPLLMLALLVTTDDDVRAVVRSPLGALCIATGLALNAAGSWWMHRIVRSGS